MTVFPFPDFEIPQTMIKAGGVFLLMRVKRNKTLPAFLSFSRDCTGVIQGTLLRLLIIEDFKLGRG
jgi:hypothetical protein